MEIYNNKLTDGIHWLSGIGHTSFHDEWNNDDIDVDLFCIDNIVYGVYTDPNDGYRSYGCVSVYPCEKCQWTFEPQKVIIENVMEKEVDEEYGYDIRDAQFLIIKDAILNKEVLRIGTDYTDDYYPYAIFHYNPMNLYVNVERELNANRS